jgi:hypothetical protein
MAAPLIHGSSQSPERRQSPRVATDDRDHVVALRLVPGLGASFRNLSAGGACIEVASRLLPGTPVDLQVALSGWQWRGRARVLRCHVSALVPDEGVRYEAALQFDISRDPDAARALLVAVQDAIRRGYELPSGRASLGAHGVAATHSEAGQTGRKGRNAGNTRA